MTIHTKPPWAAHGSVDAGLGYLPPHRRKPPSTANDAGWTFKTWTAPRAAIVRRLRCGQLGGNYTCPPFGLFADFAEFRGLYVESNSSDGPLYHVTLYRTTGTELGVAGYYVNLTRHRVDKGRWHPLRPDAKNTPMGTKSMYLLMRRVFDDLGYRRYERRCNSLSEPIRRAAQRLGFTNEGRFRQAATATPTGSRFSTANGRRSKPRLKRGSTWKTSTQTISSGGA